MSALEPYRPSNGTEGEIFKARFCDRCVKSSRDPEDEPCPIEAATFFFDIGEEGYPPEWVCEPYTGDIERYLLSPRCTAFQDWTKPAPNTIVDARQVELAL